MFKFKLGTYNYNIFAPTLVGVSISQTPGPDVFTTELNEADYPGLKKDQPQGETTKRSGALSSIWFYSPDGLASSWSGSWPVCPSFCPSHCSSLGLSQQLKINDFYGSTCITF